MLHFESSLEIKYAFTWQKLIDDDNVPEVHIFKEIKFS